RYSPENSASTSPRVFSSTRFTCFRISGEMRAGRGAGASFGAARRFRKLSTLLRGWYRVENARHDVVARHILSLRLVRDEHAVPEDVRCDRLDVVGCDVRTIAQEGNCARPLRERERCARTRTELDERREIRQIRTLRIASRFHDVDDVIDDPVVHVQVADALACSQHRLGGRDVPHGYLVLARHAAQHFLLLVARRITNVQLEHEAVDLRLGQRIGSFLLDRILRGQHEKRLLQDVRRAADRNLLLLHRFEQCGLHFRWRTIDFVRQDYVREDRSLFNGETTRRLIVHLRADDIRRQQIGGELNSLKRRADCFGQRAHGERLGQTRHTLEKHVAPREQSYEQALHHVILAYNTLPYLTDYRVDECRVFHVVAV